MKTTEVKSKYTFYLLCPVGHWAATFFTNQQEGKFSMFCPHCGKSVVARNITGKNRRVEDVN